LISAKHFAWFRVDYSIAICRFCSTLILLWLIFIRLWFYYTSFKSFYIFFWAWLEIL
jgi:hypothetical protein